MDNFLNRTAEHRLESVPNNSGINQSTESRLPSYVHRSTGRNYIGEAISQYRQRASSSAANLRGQGIDQNTSAVGTGGNLVIGRPVAMQNSSSSIVHMNAGHEGGERISNAVPANWSSSRKRKAPESKFEQVYSDCLQQSGMFSHDSMAFPCGASGSLTVPLTSQRTGSYDQLNTTSDDGRVQHVGMSSQYSAAALYGASGSSAMPPTAYPLKNDVPQLHDGQGDRRQDFSSEVFEGVTEQNENTTTVNPLTNDVPQFHDKHGHTRIEISYTDEDLEAFLQQIEGPSCGLPDQTVPDSTTELEAFVGQSENTNGGLGDQAVQQNKDVAVTNRTSLDLEPCPIRRVEYGMGDDVTILKCRHDFHMECIKQWLTTQTSRCPVCMTPAFTS